VKLKTGCRLLAMILALPIGLAAAPAAQSSKTVEIGELGPAVSVSLNVGDTLRVVLPSTPSTGYSWHVAGDDTTGAVQTKGSKYQPREQRPGASGTQTLTFLARSAGQNHLTLSYARPWEKKVKPARSYAVSVTVHPADSGSDLPVVTPRGTLIGSYSGKTLCADCSGILTTVALYAASPQQMTDTYYVRTTQYQGASKGDTTFVSAGNLSVKADTPAIYSLQSNTSDHVDSYQLKGDTLEVIDSNGKPAANPYNANLQKQ
jgi:inhibitor of cysteine peptidase